MNKVLASLAALLLIAVVALGFGLKSVYDKSQALAAQVVAVRDALVSEQKLRKADTAALSGRLVVAEQARIQKEKTDAATKKALDENPVWAGERVPDSVIDAIGM